MSRRARPACLLAHASAVLIAAGLSGAAAAQPTPDPPPELERALRAREVLRNGRIEWTIIDYMTTIEAQRQLQRVSTFTRDALLVECHPAADEPVIAQSQGRSPGLLSGLPRREFYRGDEYWAYEVGDNKADLRPPVTPHC